MTEAGEGEDGRIKSAIGIGSLLADGIGDTIRVSLTEDSMHEIPVAHELVALFANGERRNPQFEIRQSAISFDPFSYQRRASETITLPGVSNAATEVKLGGEELIRVVVGRVSFEKIAHKVERMGDYKPEIVYEEAGINEVDPRDNEAIERLNQNPAPQLVTVQDDIDLPVISSVSTAGSSIGSAAPDFAEGCAAPLRGK